ncbi:MAG: phage tail terminator protein [Cellvibrionaceae bacterium]
MSVSKKTIRDSVRELIAGVYPHPVHTTQKYSPDESELDFVLVYFTEGEVVDQGISCYVDADLEVGIFMQGDASDDQLDQYESAILGAMSGASELSQKVIGMTFRGYTYADTESENLSALILKFNLQYNY